MGALQQSSLGLVFSFICGAAIAGTNQMPTQDFCLKISKQFQAAAMIRDGGVDEAQAASYMGNLKNEEDRLPMQAAVLGAYEKYRSLTPDQIRLESYRQCLIDNKVLPDLQQKTSKPTSTPADDGPLLDPDGNEDFGNAPEYIGESPEKLLLGKWTCHNAENTHQWTDTYKPNNTVVSTELTGDHRTASGSYKVEGKIATATYNTITSKGVTSDYKVSNQILLYFTSPDFRLNNLHHAYSECSRSGT